MPIDFMHELYYTPADLAEAMGVTRRTIYRWMEKGTVSFDTYGSRYIMDQDNYDTFISANRP